MIKNISFNRNHTVTARYLLRQTFTFEQLDLNPFNDGRNNIIFFIWEFPMSKVIHLITSVNLKICVPIFATSLFELKQSKTVILQVQDHSHLEAKSFDSWLFPGMEQICKPYWTNPVLPCPLIRLARLRHKW